MSQLASPVLGIRTLSYVPAVFCEMRDDTQFRVETLAYETTGRSKPSPHFRYMHVVGRVCDVMLDMDYTSYKWHQ
jgi:hypothetical protein